MEVFLFCRDLLDSVSRSSVSSAVFETSRCTGIPIQVSTEHKAVQTSEANAGLFSPELRAVSLFHRLDVQLSADHIKRSYIETSKGDKSIPWLPALHREGKVQIRLLAHALTKPKTALTLVADRALK